MTRYLVRRLLQFIPVLIAVSFATFALIRALPGGPFEFVGDKRLPDSVVKNINERYRINDPLWKQYADYLVNMARLDFGPSFQYRNRTVNDIIGDSFPVSFRLGLLALALALTIGIPMGTFGALKQNSLVDYVSTFIAILGISIPNLVLGPLLLWLFVLKLGWFQIRWKGTPANYVLPAVALGVAMSAAIARLTRASLLQVIREDYIRTARSKGLHERTVVVRHALKNSFIPVVTVIGPLFAAVVTGTLVVEQIFAIPGMGKHFVTSVGNRDYPLITGVTLIYAVILVVSNLVVDLLYGWLDPRISYE